MASPTKCTWVWVDSGSWWRTGRPVMPRFMGSQRVRYDERLNWTEPIKSKKKKKKRIVKYLCCTLETNILLYANYNSIKVKYIKFLKSYFKKYSILYIESSESRLWYAVKYTRLITRIDKTKSDLITERNFFFSQWIFPSFLSICPRQGSSFTSG